MAKPPTITGYSTAQTLDCERILITLLRGLGPWKESIFLVGGLTARYLVWCLTNTLMKLRGHFGCRQGAMTSSGVHHATKSNAADGLKDPQIRKRICETPH